MQEDIVKVDVARLNEMEGDLKSTHRKLQDGFDNLSSELLRTLAEWGDGTDSRNAYNAFKARVDKIFAEMKDALNKMPPAVAQAAAEASHAERTNAGRFQ